LVKTATPRTHLAALAVVIGVLAWSSWLPKDRFTWFLEIAPVPIAVVLIAVAYPRWRFTPLVLWLIALHAIILMVGGKYTYAEVPMFNDLRDVFSLARNYYDRVGHVAQGFVPAMVAREILVRHGAVKRNWLFLFVTCIALSISAFYELVEWWVAAGTGTAAEAFLGTQGDVWDTQWDMFMALCGAIAAQLLLSRWHDSLIGFRAPEHA
jgi:putative membrane protein